MQKKINVFCSFSKSELNEVKNLLIPSLLHQRNNLKIDLWLINYTGKGKILDQVEDYRNLSIQEIKPDHRCGFGEAHNFAFEQTGLEYPILITNPLYLHKESLSNLLDMYERNENVGIVEARQLPFSHPKKYSKSTNETNYATGACMLLNPKMFDELSGFDENYWMYLEDVDLSWRSWMNGYRVLYHPDAAAYHYTGYYFKYKSHRYYYEHFWSLRNFIYLLRKFWAGSGEKKAMNIVSQLHYDTEMKRAAVDSYMALTEDLDDSFYNTNKDAIGNTKQIVVKGYNNFD